MWLKLWFQAKFLIFKTRYGLQSRLGRFDSDPRLQTLELQAGVAQLVERNLAKVEDQGRGREFETLLPLQYVEGQPMWLPFLH